MNEFITIEAAHILISEINLSMLKNAQQFLAAKANNNSSCSCCYECA